MCFPETLWDLLIRLTQHLVLLVDLDQSAFVLQLRAHGYQYFLQICQSILDLDLLTVEVCNALAQTLFKRVVTVDEVDGLLEGVFLCLRFII